MITIASLIAAGIHPTQAKVFADPLNSVCQLYGIDTPVRQSAFIAQCAHESAGFSQLEECLWYRDPQHIQATFPDEVHSIQQAQSLVGQPQKLANCVYANKNGNGDEASGDGWTFRGRGLLQITGRANYTEASVGAGRNWVANPGLLTNPPDACLASAWLWNKRDLNTLADVSDIRSITRAINGPALDGLPDRQQWFEQCLRALA